MGGIVSVEEENGSDILYWLLCFFLPGKLDHVREYLVATNLKNFAASSTKDQVINVI